jgi:hypothetical protein
MSEAFRARCRAGPKAFNPQRTIARSRIDQGEVPPGVGHAAPHGIGTAPPALFFSRRRKGTT